MTLYVNRPNGEVHLCESTTSIATTPVAVTAIAPVSGLVVRCHAGAAGTTTGTVTVAVAINGGSDICGSGLTVAAGTGARAGSTYELSPVGAGSTSGVTVKEGDEITFNPSGGTGSSFGWVFLLVFC